MSVRIATRSLGAHRRPAPSTAWRSELEPTGDGGTRVTETFDWPTALAPALIDRTSFPAANARGIETTLPRLKELAQSRAG